MISVSPHRIGRRDQEELIMTNSNIFDSIFDMVDERVEMKNAEEKKAAELKKQEEEKAAELKKQEREAMLAEIREKGKDASPTDSKTADKKAPSKPNAPVFQLNEDTIIRWWHMKDGVPVHEIPITAYFTPEELAEGLLVKKKDKTTERKPLEPEMLRKRMEKDFPELVKSFTEIIYMEKSNTIHPTIQAKKKGNCENVLSSDSTFPFLKKIPFSILRDFIAAAKFYSEISMEVHADIYFDTDKELYFIDFPQQVIHPIWVEVTETAQSICERTGGAFKVLEIHSHHNMAAIPSQQDNESERVPGMHYAIIGKTNQLLPNVFVRTFLSEKEGFLVKDASDIFECPFYDLPDFNFDGIEVSPL